MIIYLFAGTNGCGKSTLLVDFLRVFGVSDAEYICRGFHYASMFTQEQRESPHARDFYEYKLERAISEGRSMILEHALQSADIIERLKECKRQGYRIVSVFVRTRSPLVNLRRIDKRVREGGHAVKKSVVLCRYFKALWNLPRLKRISDEFYLYDNSDAPVLVQARIDGFRFDGRA